jgi:hypothetical protein
MRHDEDAECSQLVAYLDRLWRHGIVQKYAHINNEVYTQSWNQRNRIKAMGSPSGLPDYIIIIRNILVFIEMKSAKGRLSPKQKEWIDELKKGGEHAFVCYGFEQAKEVLNSFIPGVKINNEN